MPVLRREVTVYVTALVRKTHAMQAAIVPDLQTNRLKSVLFRPLSDMISEYAHTISKIIEINFNILGLFYFSIVLYLFPI